MQAVEKIDRQIGKKDVRLSNGKHKKFNVYVTTRDGCDIKLADMVEQVKAEIAEEKERYNAE